MYMNNHVHSAPPWKKEENRENRKKNYMLTKIHNNLNAHAVYKMHHTLLEIIIIWL